MATELIATLITQGTTKLLASLIAAYLARKVRSIAAPAETLTTAFEQYFESTFLRCTKVKTLLSEDSVDLLSCHVTQTFKVGDKTLDHYSVVDEVKSGTNFIFSGTGGSGKSVFNRYLWISLLESTDGCIPIYYELKDINLSKDDRPDLLELIYYSTINTRSNVSFDQFAKACLRGEFVLLLDGFDEISNDRRQRIEQQIIALRRDNPKSRLLVTSRPDERFAGWPEFKTASIQPLTQGAVVELIRRAEFNDKYRNEMLKRLKTGELFKTHGTFLTNPLLCYLMLVTISSESRIETTRSLFYEQAFEALFFRHDLRKGGYVRQMHSGLDKNQFKTLFAYFSLRSYLSDKLDYDDATMAQHIEKAQNACGIKAPSSDFVLDCVESVCMIKKEGLVYNYTHRSLQEYFAASSRLLSKNVPQVLEAFASRRQDQTLSLAYEISPDVVVRDYVKPRVERYSRALRLGVKKLPESLELFMETLTLGVEPGETRLTMTTHMGVSSDKYGQFHSAIARLSGRPSSAFYFEPSFRWGRSSELAAFGDALIERIGKQEFQLRLSSRDKKLRATLFENETDASEERNPMPVDLLPSEMRMLNQSSLASFHMTEVQSLRDAVESIMKAYEERSKGAEELIG